MKTVTTRRVAAASASVIALGCSGAAWAQSAPAAGEGAPIGTANPGPAAAPQSTDIGEVVVYAERKSVGTTAQRVPVAVTALDRQVIAATHAVNLLDIGALAPNVQTNTTGTISALPNFAIRGVGITGSLRSIDPAVNVIQDGFVLTYQLGAIVNTFDLDSIEVLRGPQGVLFGRYSTGGAIVLRTRRPSDQYQALVDVSVGNYSDVNANASVEGPIAGDRVQAKLAVLWHSNSGMFRNTNEGLFIRAVGNPSGAAPIHSTSHVGDVNDLIIKPTFVFKISDNTRITLFGQYQRNNDDGPIPRNYPTPAGLPNTTQAFLDFGYTPTTTGYETNINFVGYQHLREGHVIAEMENDIGPGVLTTTAGYRNVRFNSATNNVATPFDIFLLPDNKEKNHEESIESRYNVPLSKNVEALVGLYYMRSDVDVVERRLTAGPQGTPVPQRYLQGTFDQVTDAYAAYANVDWTIVPDLKLSAGGRYSVDRKSFDYTLLLACTGVGFGACNLTPHSASKRWSNFSPRVVLSWQAADHVLAYASYTQGFRSGNYNPRTADPTGVGVGPASPEDVKSYEVGVKSDLLDRRLRVNVDVFQSDYTNIQQLNTVPTNGAPIQSLVNVASATIKGVEGEFAAKPAPWLLLNANIGYLDANYKKFDRPLAGVANPLALRLPKIPKWTAYVAATYSHQLANDAGEISARVSYDYRSNFVVDFLNTPGLAQSGYGLTGADLTFSRENWTVSLFGRNLGNVAYADTKSRNLVYIAYGGQPRTFGVRVTARFQ